MLGKIKNITERGTGTFLNVELMKTIDYKDEQPLEFDDVVEINRKFNIKTLAEKIKKGEI